MSADQCGFRSAAGIRCHRVNGHDGGHKPYPPDWDLPADLADVLADQSIVVPQDQAVWELMGDAALKGTAGGIFGEDDPAGVEDNKE